jgi:hypothetical protein
LERARQLADRVMMEGQVMEGKVLGFLCGLRRVVDSVPDE